MIQYESGRITEAACMAYDRRKIHNVHEGVPADITTEALQRIGDTVSIEAEVQAVSGGKKSPGCATDAITV